MSGPSDKAVLILGCGFTGAVLAQRLAFKGRPVVGTTRSDLQASVIRTRGAEPVLMDTSDLSPLNKHRGRFSAVVSMIPPRMSRDGTYEDAHGELLAFFADQPVSAFVYVSSTSVYGDKAGEVVTEATPCTPDSPRGEARLAIERQVLESGLPGMVVRPSGIYGPGRSMLHRLAAGRYRLVGGGVAITNRIHVRDLAGIIEAAIARGEAGKVYLASDAAPTPSGEVARYAVETWGLPEPSDMPLAEAKVRLDANVYKMLTGSKRLDGSWTREALGVRLRYPSYREGLADVWRQQSAEIQALVGH